VKGQIQGESACWNSVPVDQLTLDGRAPAVNGEGRCARESCRPHHDDAAPSETHAVLPLQRRRRQLPLPPPRHSACSAVKIKAGSAAAPAPAAKGAPASYQGSPLTQAKGVPAATAGRRSLTKSKSPRSAAPAAPVKSEAKAAPVPRMKPFRRPGEQ
jgi:hypothetical protein